MPKPARYIADHLRRVLVDGASAPHTAEVEQFFKEEIQSRGWYTDELRKLARRFTKVIKGDAGLDYLVEIADDLFNGSVLEEKILAVQLLETSPDEFTAAHYATLTAWIPRISTWADCDALSSYLLGPYIAREPARAKDCLKWAKSDDRWTRRTAAVALIRGVRLQMFEQETRRITGLLLGDGDDMVQKGLGWLLREAAKYNREFAVPLLREISARAPKLVLRTACETLPKELGAEIRGVPVRPTRKSKIKNRKSKI